MPGVPVVLETHGGLITSVRPEELPEGVSPRTQESDFLMGRVVQRPGLRSQYSIGSDGGTSEGPSFGSSAFQINFPPAIGQTWANPSNILLNDGTSASVSMPPLAASQSLVVIGFGFTIPGDATITGFEITVGVASASISQSINVSMISNLQPIGVPRSSSVPSGGGAVTIGNSTTTFDAGLIPQTVNTLNFGVSLIAENDSPSTGVVNLDYVTIKVFYITANLNFLGLSSFVDSTGTQYTMALDADGVTRQEDVTSNPNVLMPSILPPVPPGSYMKGIQAGKSAFLAYSDLTQGTAMPMQFNGEWADRITQVGPGAPPTFQASQNAGDQATVTAYSANAGILTLTANNTYTAGEIVQLSGFSGALIPLNGLSFSILGTGLSTTQFEISTGLVTGSGTDTGTATPQFSYGIVASPLGIVQPPQMSDPSDPGHFQSLLWASGPGSNTTGNVITVYYSNQFVHALPDTVLTTAFNSGIPVYVYITNAPFGNGTWQVTSVGSDVPPHGEYARWYFTYQVPTTNYQFFGGPDDATGNYQITSATLTTTTPVPNLSPGNQVSLAGVTNSSWDGIYTITQSLNSGIYAISQTSVDSSGNATYTWALQSGIAPAAGDLVTVTGTLNANGTLNVVNAPISSATGITSGTFVVAGFAAIAFPTAVEAGEAVTAGTKFAIDPGAALVNTTAQSPILGNSGGGTLTVVGAQVGNTFPIGAGTRQGVVFFISRNGAPTRPSPPFVFTVEIGANYITLDNIPIGPPNTVARGIAITEAGSNGVPGANFYTYSQPVTFTVNGVAYLASALIVNDNTTTTAKFTFSDGVLLSALAIDIPGNNYFSLMELGNPAWIFQYANRMLYGLCQTKIQNLLNYSFDGGYLPNSGVPPSPVTGGTALLPLGWKVDPDFAFPQTNGIQLAISPLFGNSLILQNSTGSDQAILGMITQGAYQDAFFAPIIDPNVNYSVRVTCRVSSIVTGGVLNIDLVDSNNGIYGKVYGTFTCTPTITNFITFTGPLMSKVTVIPPGLLLRVYTTNIPDGESIEIDRLEVFDTDNAIDQTIIWTSYVGKFEAVDEITGSLGVGSENSQPATGAFEILNQLFIDKTNSMMVTQDSPNYEPAQWTVHLASDKSGACGPNAFDFGEEFSITINRRGIYGFNGGTPMPISGELQGTATQTSLWEMINWSAAKTIWTRIDFVNNRLLFGIPLPTPNFWLPDSSSSTTNRNIVHIKTNIPFHGITVVTVTFNVAIPNILPGQQYTFSGLTTLPILNGQSYIPVSISGNSALFDTKISSSLIDSPETGSALISPVIPESPNVILMCNYNGCPTYEELVGAAPVHTTMFGDEKAPEQRRKWSLWKIPCPIAERITREDGFTDPLLLCNGIQSSKIYQLINGSFDGTGQNSDDGVFIPFRHFTYGFVRPKQGQTTGLGGVRTVWYYLAGTFEGVGTLDYRLYPNTLGAQYPFTGPLPITLTYPAQNDQERVLEIAGQRVFLEFEARNTFGNGPVNSYCEIGTIMMDGAPDTHSPHRGVSS